MTLLAETVRNRWVIALASIAAAGTLVAVMPCGSETAHTPKRSTIVKPWRGCMQREVIKPKPPIERVDGASYRDTLMAVRPAFEACMAKQPAGVTYTVRANIDGGGGVLSVDVRGEHADLSKVDMHVVKCMERTMSGLRFPATQSATSVSTTFVTPTSPTIRK